MSFLIPGTSDSRRLLGVYVYYRFGLGLLLGMMHWTGVSEDIFGDAHPELFSSVVLIYVVICAISVGLYLAAVLQTHTGYLLILPIIDFVAIDILILASSNLSGGLAYLLLIPMAVGSTFLRGLNNIGLAALATLLILGITLYSINQEIADSRSFFSAGLIGISLFVTAIVFRTLSEKLQTSEHTARRKADQANYSQLISQRIVETMRTGIVVIDRNLHTQLINDAARTLLTVDDQFEEVLDVPEMYDRLSGWQRDGIIPNDFSFHLADNRTLKISFLTLEDSRFPSIMIFIEDMQRLNQQAQQLKLASLGHLSASIAHEIRNPLGAISHASQLLGESDNMDASDQHLLGIIHNHSRRINFIINNILEFSRRKNAQPEVINLNQWLADFAEEYQQYHSGKIIIGEEQKNLYTLVDPNHLYQIISNLVDNGMRYSHQCTGELKVLCRIGTQKKPRQPWIEIIDFGDGIDSSGLDQLFEPFYTTETAGSGLGLYVCKELSEANQAVLGYRYDQQQKLSIFKLVLASSQKKALLQ